MSGLKRKRPDSPVDLKRKSNIAPSIQKGADDVDDLENDFAIEDISDNDDAADDVLASLSDDSTSDKSDDKGFDEAIARRKEKKKAQLLKLKAKKAVESAKGRKGAEAIHSALTSDDPQLQGSVFWELVLSSKAGSQMTDIERSYPFTNDYVAFFDNSKRDATHKSISDLVPVVKFSFPGWQKAVGWKQGASKRQCGSPSVLFVCPSTNRCSEFLRALIPFKARIAKLFAKHMSVEDQRKELQSNPPIIFAVGTPNRISKLLEEDAFSLDLCQLIVWDVHPDPKGFNLFDSFATKEDALSLYINYFHERIVASHKPGSGKKPMKMTFY